MKDYMILLIEYLLSSCICEWLFYILEDELKEIVNFNVYIYIYIGLLF